MTNDKTPEDKPSFEQALERLEEIVTQIEQGEVPLEESIEKYAEGVKLLKTCRTILDSAEKKIQLLARGEGDTVESDGELETPDES